MTAQLRVNDYRGLRREGRRSADGENEICREENLKKEGIDLKGSRMVRRWRKDKGSYMEEETKRKRIVMVNFSEPPCSSHHFRDMFSIPIQLEQTFQPW